MSMLELVIYFGLALLGFIYLIGKRPRSKNYPPGPWGYPIFGHLLRISPKNPYIQMKAWAEKYGPVMSLNMGQWPTVVLNDVKLVRTAFSDNEVAGRPNFPSFGARSGGEIEGVIFTEGKKWVEQRRFTLRTLRDFGFGKKTMEGAVHEEVKELIERFRKDIGKPVSTQNRFNAAVLNALWTLIVGERYRQDDPELKVAIKHLTTNLQDINIRSEISNFIPILARIAPKLSGFEKLMKDVIPIWDFLRKPIEAHKATYQPDQPRDYIDVYLDEMNKCNDPTSSFYKENGDKSLLFSMLDLFTAGAETTSTTMAWTFLYMAKFPEVQKKLREEIRRVVGDSRLPSLNDRPNMPYTESVIHEVMRYSSLVPLGVVHYTNSEVKIGDYIIPKDTMVMANQKFIHFDEKIWGDPMNFRPERFLSKDGKSFVRNEALIPFSVGKRVCPGETLGKDELFLFTTSLFQVFNVAPATSEKDLSLEPFVGGVLMPQPYEVILTEVH